MFRDESSKVIQKAHAQWGGPNDPAEASSVSPSPPPATTTTAAATTSSASSADADQTLPASEEPSSSVSLSPSEARSPPQRKSSSVLRANANARARPPSASSAKAKAAETDRLWRPLDNLEEAGINFCLTRYIVDQLDEPPSREVFSSLSWIWTPAYQNVMVAVGLAGMSHLKGDPKLMMTARQKYGVALRQTGQLIQNRVAPTTYATMHLVVMLALFEVRLSLLALPKSAPLLAQHDRSKPRWC